MLPDSLVPPGSDPWEGCNPTAIHESKHAYALKTRSELDMDSGELNFKKYEIGRVFEEISKKQYAA